MAEAAISAAQVKQLREATGMGMMECKKALVECGGDFDKATDWLRVKSGAKADKVSARSASEGRVAFAEGNGVGALVEISCETDFVARDENIAAFAAAVAQAAAAAGTLPEALGELALADGQTAEQARQEMVMKLGENIGIRRARLLPAGDGVICAYVHNGDKIGAMCALSGDAALGHDVCMHVAAMQPQYLDADAVPAEVIAREREVFISQVRESGKPAEMAEQIAAGKLKKRLAEITLQQQAFIKDTDKTIAQVLEGAGARLHGFSLLVVGAAD